MNKKLLVGIGITSLLLSLTACNTSDISEEQNSSYNIEVTQNLDDTNMDTTIETAIHNYDWNSDIVSIANSNKSKIEKVDEVTLSSGLRSKYAPTEVDIEQFEQDIVDAFESGKYLSDIANEEYALTLIFKSIVVEKYHEDLEQKPIDKFVFDFYQVVRDVYRGAESPNGEFVQANIEQMNKALSEIN